MNYFIIQAQPGEFDSFTLEKKYVTILTNLIKVLQLK